jgi:thiamine biosynthesis lipoprotein
MSPTSRRRFLIASLGSGAALGLGLAGYRRGKGEQVVCQKSAHALGSKVAITALAPSETAGDAAIEGAFAEIERVESVLSLYRANSQVSQLNHTGVVAEPHPFLVEVLNHALATSRRSGGAFDVTVQPLWDFYAAAGRERRVPGDAEIAATRAKVDWRRLHVATDRVTLEEPVTAITLNGIAQGFATDRALAVLKSHGIEHALVDAGELASLGRNRAGEPWNAGVQHPREPEAYAALVPLDGRAMATSGDYATSFSDDFRHNHIFDPRTGASPQSFASVTVLAETTMAADALSTACFVLSPEDARRLISETPGADLFAILKDGRTLATPGFPVA